ncbi:MAG: acyl carrier protein [Treponema sp.]|nr:acyl carrier protein [Treponema sp.]
MTKEEIFAEIQNFLVTEFEIDKEKITLESKLYDDLELDSIDAIDLMVKMKEFIQGKIQPDQFKQAVTIQDIIEIIYPLINP